MTTHGETKPHERDKIVTTIIDKMETVKKSGFGEVRILIRNVAVYRILTTEDEAVNKE